MILTKEINKTKLTGNELKKYRRRKKILDLLYTNEELSGPVISKRIGVSLPTGILLLNELIELNFVEERGAGISKGGRKPTMYGLSADSIFVIACEIGRYKGKITIYNSHNKPATPLTYFDTSINDEDLVKKIYQKSKELMVQNNIDEERVFGVGVSMPGLIDQQHGINLTINNKAFRNVKERLEKEFNRMVYVNNDARMQAYGEYIFGAAAGHKNAVIVNWNHGIGLGLIINEKLYDGSNGFAGELSHIQLVEDGDLCICGKRGCLETITSANILLNNAIEGIKSNKVSQLTNKFSNQTENLKIEDIVDAAKSGDEFSISLLNETGQALGKGLAITIQILNPDIIVIGGPVSAANQYILTPIQQSLNRHCLGQIYENTNIQISEIWEQSGLLGLTALLHQKLFSDMTINM